MMRALLPLLLSLALGVASIPASAADALLRSRVVVEGESVTLGDLFDNAGERSTVKVMRAPPPGQRVTVDNDWLAHVALVNGITWHPRGLFEDAVIERAGIAVPHDQILAKLQDALAQQGAPPDSLIESDLGNRQVVLPIGVTPSIAVRDLFYDRDGARFSANVTIFGANGGNDTTRLVIAGHLYPTVQIPVLSRQIGRGDVITTQDIAWLKLRQDAVRPSFIADPDLMIGMTARQNLRAGQPLSAGELQKSLAVQRGAIVTMLLNYRGMELIGQGRAVDQGAVGDVIHVVNTHSNLTVEGTVVSTNQVRVSITGPIASAN
jgi:flagella basal body P-ring formation protein FlgA